MMRVMAVMVMVVMMMGVMVILTIVMGRMLMTVAAASGKRSAPASPALF